MQLELYGARIVITGASSGIGRATALALAAEGATLALGARSSEQLETVAQECQTAGAKVVTCVGDLTSADGVAALVSAAQHGLGGVTGLVTCVGATPMGDFDALDDATWHTAFETKFLATVRAVRAALPELRRSGGRAVLVGGNTAHDPTPWMATSGAINAALGNLVATLARTYGSAGVGFVCCSPGPVRTDRYVGLRQVVMDRFDLDAESAEAKIAEWIPRGQSATAKEAADVITMLLSPRSVHVSGTVVTVDGGQTWAR